MTLRLEGAQRVVNNVGGVSLIGDGDAHPACGNMRRLAGNSKSGVVPVMVGVSALLLSFTGFLLCPLGGARATSTPTSISWENRRSFLPTETVLAIKSGGDSGEGKNAPPQGSTGPLGESNQLTPDYYFGGLKFQNLSYKSGRSPRRAKSRVVRRAPARKVLTRSTALRTGKVSFIWPLVGRITSPFGMRGGSPHNGLDISHPLRNRASIRAAAKGTVTYAGGAGTYGNLIKINHGSGFETRYAHLSRIYVRRGQRVAAGSLVGLMGSTGRSTGPHLHFEIRRNGRPYNPLTFLSSAQSKQGTSTNKTAGVARSTSRIPVSHQRWLAKWLTKWQQEIPFLFAKPAFVSREAWGAKGERTEGLQKDVVRYLVIHHTDTPPSPTTQAKSIRQLRAMEKDHLRRDWRGLGYNALIDPSGFIYEGYRPFGLSRASALEVGHASTHAGYFNKGSFGISFIGEYENEQRLSSGSAEYKAMVDLLVYTATRDGRALLHIDEDGEISYRGLVHFTGQSARSEYIRWRDGGYSTDRPMTILGHGQTKDTDCPGKNVKSVMASAVQDANERIQSVIRAHVSS